MLTEIQIVLIYCVVPICHSIQVHAGCWAEGLHTLIHHSVMGSAAGTAIPAAAGIVFEGGPGG